MEEQTVRRPINEEDEHRATQMMAMQELLQKRNADMAGYRRYRRGKSEWGELQRFNSELVARAVTVIFM